MNVAERLKSNLYRVREQIADACYKAGRDPESVRLVGVTKYLGADLTAELVRAGLSDIGENRPQALTEKVERLSGISVRWHLIGHLQRNKVKLAVRDANLIHSIDSLPLLIAVNRAAVDMTRTVDVLIEINISGDLSKHGLRPEELRTVLESARSLENTRIRGLMGMSGLTAPQPEKRRQFAVLRELMESHPVYESDGILLNELSMGMSDDFAEAIAEGSTIVRIGSLLFEGLDPLLAN